MSESETTFPWDVFMHNIGVLMDEAGGQAAFAVKIGISFHTIEGWKTGRYNAPSWYTLDRIAEEYDMTIDDLTKRRLPKSR